MFLSFVTQLIVKIQIDWQFNCHSSGSLKTKLLPLCVIDWEPREELLVILGDECGYSSSLFKSDSLQIISAIQNSIRIGIQAHYWVKIFMIFEKSPNFIRNVSIEYCNPSWIFSIKYRQISNPKKKSVGILNFCHGLFRLVIDKKTTHNSMTCEVAGIKILLLDDTFRQVDMSRPFFIYYFQQKINIKKWKKSKGLEIIVNDGLWIR